MLNPSDGAPDHEQYVRGIRADKEANTFIAKREAQREAAGEPRSAQAIWRESERHYDAARLGRMRAAWCEYHRGQAERHRAALGALVDYHERRAEHLEAAS